MLDYLMKHLQQQSSTMNSVASRLATALAGCAQRSSLGNFIQSTRFNVFLFYFIFFKSAPLESSQLLTMTMNG